MIKSITTAALILLIAQTEALAQEAGAPRGHGKTEFLKKYDTDLDGEVSQAEYEAARVLQYKDIDADGDGVLTEEEYVAEYSARLDQELAAMRSGQIEQARVRFGVIDADKSSLMTAGEFSATGARTFEALDTNQDGRVTQADTAKEF